MKRQRHRHSRVTPQQLARVANELIASSDGLLKRHGWSDGDGARLHMMLLAFAAGAIIGGGTDADQREAVIAAALLNLRQGVRLGATGSWLSTRLGSSCTVH